MSQRTTEGHLLSRSGIVKKYSAANQTVVPATVKTPIVKTSYYSTNNNTYLPTHQQKKVIKGLRVHTALPCVPPIQAFLNYEPY